MVEQSAIKVEGDGSRSHRRTVALPIFKAPQSGVALSEDKLICHSCPIPYRMNEALEVIEQTASALLSSFQEELSPRKKVRLLFAYLLMGMPNRQKYLRGF